MKTKITSVIFLFCAFILNAQSGAYIEYKLISDKGHSGTVKVRCSDLGSISEINMAVPQMPGGAITTKSLLQKDKPGTIFMINDQNKSYSEVSSAATPGDTKNYTAKKLGEETVNGYKCVHALVTEENETQEVWNTKEIPDYNKYEDALKSNKQTGSPKRMQALKAAGCEGFPVKTIHKGNAQQGNVTLELVKLEKKTFPASEFEIPAGYTKAAQGSSTMRADMKSQQEIMNMTPEERAKYAEELKKKYAK